MKNILITSDVFLNGGLETRLNDEVAEYKKHNYNVFLACKTLNEEYRDIFDDVLLLPEMTFDYTDEINSKELLSVRDKIIDFCKKHSVDLIECQPFWVTLPAALAAESLNIPVTYTLHGAASGNFANFSYIGLYTVYYLTLKYGFDRVFAVAEHLQKQFSYLSQDITIVRNGMTTPATRRPSRKTSRPNGHFCIASRLDIPKSKIIMDFLPIIHDIPAVKKIDIFGDGDCMDTLKGFVVSNNFDKVACCGWTNDLQKTIADNNYDAVFGMGRVVLDAISANTPVGILGFNGFVGFLCHENIAHFANSNLTSWEKHDDINLGDEIALVQKHPAKYSLSKEDLSLFDTRLIWSTYFKIESEVKHSSKPFLKFLNSALEGNSSSSFNFKKFVAETPLPIAENDVLYPAYLSSIFNDIEKNKKIESLEKTISEITNSGFWKATKPVRSVLGKLH